MKGEQGFVPLQLNLPWSECASIFPLFFCNVGSHQPSHKLVKSQLEQLVLYALSSLVLDRR